MMSALSTTSGVQANMHDMIEIDISLIKLGKPLDFAVYKADGSLLLNKGHMVQSEQQLEQLVKRGMFMKKSDKAGASADDKKKVVENVYSPFFVMEELHKRFTNMYAAISSSKTDALERVEKLTKALILSVKKDTDAYLGYIHIPREEIADSKMHAISYAIISYAVGSFLQYDEARLNRLVKAALLANIMFTRLHEKLNHSEKKLSEQQREEVNKHPQQSVEKLKLIGVTDDVLLKIIAQHHENVDGSGYPQQVKGEAILQEAKLINACEHYLSKVIGRGYRPPQLSNTVLRDLYQNTQKDPQEIVYIAMLKALTVYPPGTLVKLANEEVCMVARRTDAATAPEVRAIFNARGAAYRGAVARDTSKPEFKVTGPVLLEKLPPIKFPVLWGYKENQ